MVKRKLSNKQTRNQANIQTDRIQRAKKSDLKAEEALKSSDLSPEQEGLLVAHHGVHLIVEGKEGNLHQCQCRQAIGPLATGDKVIWRAFKDGTGVIVAHLPRNSLLTRTAGKHDVRPMAANVDLIVIVIAPSPAPSETTLDRYLIISELLQIPCLILVNKADLLEQHANPDFEEYLQTYTGLGIPLIKTSSKLENGLGLLKKALQHHTSIFVGQSGVGKSSLISSLVPDAEIRIGALSVMKDLGKHTTTTARLYHLPDGGDLIDSPGIRRFGLWHLPKEELILGFREFKPYLDKCQFRNCQHRKEPGCALIAAAGEGLVHPKRLANFHTLLDEPNV